MVRVGSFQLLVWTVVQTSSDRLLFFFMSDFVWFGSAGHLCVASMCRFHLCTQVGKYLVSTVGEYIPDPAKNEKRTLGIGENDFYETMVFECGGPCPCGCGMPEINGSELDCVRYATSGEANAGHMSMCNKWVNDDLIWRDEVRELLSKINKRHVSYLRAFVDLGLSITESILLTQCVFWSQQKSNSTRKGWFYKTLEEWEQEIGFSRAQIESARDKLINKQLLQHEVFGGIPPKSHYQVNFKSIFGLLSRISICGKVAPHDAEKSHRNAETTARKHSQKEDQCLLANTAFPDNLNTDAFKSLWAEWEAFRKQSRHTLNAMTRERQLKKLSGMGIRGATQSIEQSITNGWIGLFDPKGNQLHNVNVPLNYQP